MSTVYQIPKSKTPRDVRPEDVDELRTMPNDGKSGVWQVTHTESQGVFRRQVSGFDGA